MERSKNEAEAYANDVIPRARGEAAKIMQAAEAYKQKVVAAAEGEASRFVSIYNEYAKAKAPIKITIGNKIFFINSSLSFCLVQEVVSKEQLLTLHLFQ